jgi:hypothetical protein
MLGRRLSHSNCIIIAAIALTVAKTAAGVEPPEPESGDPGQQTAPAGDEHERAERELKQETKQRILGIFPNFNTSNIPDAARLSSKQKFRLALRGALDPVTFAAAGFIAGWEQARDTYPDYGQGAEGYAKRFGAAYADSFNSALLGGAVFPSLLHQDPRYFRKGTGRFSRRLFYAISSTVKAKNDNGHWAPNYSNVLGNFAAGGISNLYYPKSERGFELTVERSLVVTAQGALGAILVEFWPDISAKFHKH